MLLPNPLSPCYWVPMMDALDQAIEAKRLEIARMRSRMEILSAELAALEFAAHARPPTNGRGEANNGSRTVQSIGRSGAGRRPGAISHQWRSILAAVYSSGAAQNYEGIRSIASNMGTSIAPSSVRDRVRSLVDNEFMTGSPESGFIVTEVAAKRFGFAKENAPPEGGAEFGEGSPSPDDLLIMK